MATAQVTAKALCGADKRSGDGTCTRPAGWGTQHPGTGHCKFHGGSTPNGQLFAAREEVALLGFHTEIDIEPHEALLVCVRLTAGRLAYCTHKVEELKQDEHMGRLLETSEKTFFNDDGDSVTYEEKKDKGPDLHAWIRVQREAVHDLAKFSKMAIDAGVEERRVALAERWGDRLTLLLQGVMSDLKLSAKQKKEAPQIIARRLTALEIGGRE